MMAMAQGPIHPIDAPPAIYRHGHRGAVTVRHTQHGIVSQYRALGCSKVDTQRCFVMIPKIGGPITGRIQAQIRAHEMAHCNGWSADHSH